MFIELKGDRPVEGRSAPGVRNTLVVFLRFFHLARRFWNQTWKKKKSHIVNSMKTFQLTDEQHYVRDSEENALQLYASRKGAYK